MSDDKQEQPEELPAYDDMPTPEDMTDGQVATTDVVQSITSVIHDAFGFGTGRAYQYGKQRSEFDEQDLNVLINLVENTKPSHLEEAGHALWRASKAINDAAEELRKNIKTASDDWKGQAGTSFETWGTKLAGTTEKLATYVELAGVQVASAATGLSSVKSSLPPRDTRPGHKALRPEKFPETKKTEDNPEYAEALKVEADRQEAINQLNRLASFYSVSAEGLSKLQSQEPTFEMMPNVGVPRPKKSAESGGSGETGSTVPSARQAEIASPRHAAVAEHAIGHPIASDTNDVNGSITMPDRTVPVPDSRHDVGTEIDSVGTLPPPTTQTPGGTPPSTTAPTNVTPNPTAPFGPTYSNPVPSRTTPGYGNPGGRSPLAPQGRPSNTGNKSPLAPQGRPSTTTGSPSPNRGTSANPMGRGGTNGQSGGTTNGRPTTTQRGISGGTPRANSPAGGRSSGLGNAGADRNGVVGGRPTNGPGAAGKNGSRVPRGTVVGSEGPGSSRSGAGRIGQRGVLGASPSETTAAKSANGGRRVQGASEAVTGKPTGRNAGGRTGRTAFNGGSGLVRGPGGKQRPEDEETETSQRPDYLVEDPETHMPDNPRRDVPPVIN